MTPDDHRRAKELFAEAIDLAAEEIDAFVDRARADYSPEVVSSFEQMLADYRLAEDAGFLSGPAVPEDSQETQALSDQTTDDTVQFTSGAALSSRPSDSARPASVLADDYEILEELGRGGMGAVYRAYQRSLRRHVAVKIIPSQLIRSPQESARFYLEAEAAASLDHPGIVAVQDVGERNGVHYYAMSLVTGGSLDRFVGKGERVTRQRAAELIELVSRAVQYAHDHAVIHRDIKPANILLDEEGAPRLTDFGLVKFTNADDQLTMTGQVMGTPSYMAPEQAEGDATAISTRTDVYSLGATLYALLSGKPPFAGETLFSTLQQVQKSSPPPLPSTVPADLRTICEKCLAKSPQDRYDSAGELADDLRRYLDGFPIAARRAGLLRRAVSWSRRNRMEAALISIVAITLLGATVFSTLQYLRAQSSLEQARAEADKLEAAIDDTLMFASEELLIDAPGMEQTRQTLLLNAQRYYKQQLADGRLEPAKVADVTLRLGKTYNAMGDFESAETSYKQAISLFDETLNDSALTEDTTHWHSVARLAQAEREYAALGQTIATLARDDETVEPASVQRGVQLFASHTKRCAELREQVVDARPHDLEAKRLLANAWMNLALASLDQFQLDPKPELLSESSELIERSQSQRTEILKDHPEPDKVTIDLAIGCEARAQMLLVEAETASPEDVDSLNKDALRARLECIQHLGSLPVERLDRRALDLASTAWRNCGASYLDIGRTEEAIASFQRMLAYREQMLARDPGVTLYRVEAARAYYDLAQVLHSTGETGSGLAHFDRCLDVLAVGPTVRADDKKPIELLVEFTKTWAKELAQQGLAEEAIGRISHGRDALKKTPTGSPSLPQVRKAIAELDELEQLLLDEADDPTT